MSLRQQAKKTKRWPTAGLSSLVILQLPLKSAYLNWLEHQVSNNANSLSTQIVLNGNKALVSPYMLRPGSIIALCITLTF